MKEVVDLGIPVKADVHVAEAIGRLTRGGCGSDGECAALYRFIARAEESRKNERSALAYLRLAAEREPDDHLLVDVAARASQAGLHVEAENAYAKLAERDPTNPRWRQALESERAAVAAASDALRRPPFP